MEARQLDDLGWLGLDWDEGPDVGGPHAPYRQSERSRFYEKALAQLAAAGRLFPCRRSRRDLERLASAPHGAEGLPPYPADFRPRQLEAGWYERLAQAEHPDAALRFLVHDRPVRFVDLVQGPVEERVDRAVGDFVLKRRDGLYAYQLAVVVDDLAMEIGEVVRGADLLASTARQIQLIEALGGEVPTYAHLPLAVGEGGEKLSKQAAGLTLRSLREAGGPPRGPDRPSRLLLRPPRPPGALPAGGVGCRLRLGAGTAGGLEGAGGSPGAAQADLSWRGSVSSTAKSRTSIPTSRPVASRTRRTMRRMPVPARVTSPASERRA